jgi:hypothetical protein
VLISLMKAAGSSSTVDAMVGAAIATPAERGDFSGPRKAPPFREWFAGAGSLPA